MTELEAPATPPSPAFRDDDIPGQTRFAGIFAASRHDRFCYVHGIGWHHWTGTRWAYNKKGEAQQSLIQMLKTMHTQAFGNAARVTEISKMTSDSAQKGILSIASVLPTMAVGPDEIDVDPYLLNCANGTLDLRTLELREHDPADRLTKVTNAAYDPAAKAPTWDAFITEILPDPEVRGFFQRYVGIAVLGLVREHHLAIATGVGANGKSTSVTALLYTLGDYGHMAEPDLFMKAKASPNSAAPALLNLMGRRFVVTQETEEGAPLAVALMKTLVGGDQITARGLYQPVPITFNPSHTALMVTNHLPKVPANDDALWRRLVVIPFDVVIPEEARDPELPEKLKLEADGVLNWIIAGYVDYTDNGGLRPPNKVKAATAKYRTESDDVSRFIEDTCYTAPDAKATRSDIWSAWIEWAAGAGVPRGQQKDLYDRLVHLGFTEFRTAKARGFRGLGIDAVDTDDVFDPSTTP